MEFKTAREVISCCGFSIKKNNYILVCNYKYNYFGKNIFVFRFVCFSCATSIMHKIPKPTLLHRGIRLSNLILDSAGLDIR